MEDTRKKFCFFSGIHAEIRGTLSLIPFYYLLIKPSLSRNGIIKEIIYANTLIRNEIKSSTGNNHFINIYGKMIDKDGRPIAAYFEDDGLHLNKNGYAVWREVIMPSI